MFSRSTAPAHCARGRDSIGRQARRSLISASASDGVSMPPALLLLVGLVEYPDLLVEAIRDGVEPVDVGVVLLRLALLELGFLLGRERRGVRRELRVVLELDAREVGLHVLVVLLHQLLAREHFLLRRNRA